MRGISPDEGMGKFAPVGKTQRKELGVGMSSSEFPILQLSFSLKYLKISQIAAWKLPLCEYVSSLLAMFCKLGTWVSAKACDHSLWNLDATKNCKILD